MRIPNQQHQMGATILYYLTIYFFLHYVNYVEIICQKRVVVWVNIFDLHKECIVTIRRLSFSFQYFKKNYKKKIRLNSIFLERLAC